MLLVTLAGTLFFDLEVALFSGIILSLFFYLEKTAKPNIAEMGIDKKGHFINLIRDSSIEECPQLKVIRIDGSIYFGAIDVLSDYFSSLYEKEEIFHVLIIAKGINFIDLAGAEWITNETLKWQNRGGGIYFSGLKIVSQQILTKGGFRNKIGVHNFFKDKYTAINTIFNKLEPKVCEACNFRVFKECDKKT